MESFKQNGKCDMGQHTLQYYDDMSFGSYLTVSSPNAGVPSWENYYQSLNQS